MPRRKSPLDVLDDVENARKSGRRKGESQETAARPAKATAAVAAAAPGKPQTAGRPDPTTIPLRGVMRMAGAQQHPEAPDPSQPVDPQQKQQLVAHRAKTLETGVFPAMMASALGLGNGFDVPAFAAYLREILAQHGDPTDPTERMLIEQLCMAHFRIAHLHVHAGSAQTLEAVKVYSTAAVRLLGELRRTALTLRNLSSGGKAKKAPPLKLRKGGRKRA